MTSFVPAFVHCVNLVWGSIVCTDSNKVDQAWQYFTPHGPYARRFIQLCWVLSLEMVVCVCVCVCVCVFIYPEHSRYKASYTARWRRELYTYIRICTNIFTKLWNILLGTRVQYVRLHGYFIPTLVHSTNIKNKKRNFYCWNKITLEKVISREI